MNFITKLGAFHNDILISINDSNDEFIAFITQHLQTKEITQIKKGEVMNLKPYIDARTWESNEGFVIMRMVNDIKTPYDIGMLAHECLHIVLL